MVTLRASKKASPAPDELRGATAPLAPGVERALQRAMDLGERAFCLLLYGGLFVRVGRSLALAPWDAVLLLSEGLVVFFIVFRRRALAVSTRPVDWLMALVGTATAMMVAPGGHPLAPPSIGAGLMIIGLILSIGAKLTLRRSFALAAANRGVVDSGPYAWVRHPIYGAYILVYIGFFLDNPTPWNAAVYLVTIALLIARVLAEETILSRDPRYGAFMARVRYRLVPGLF